ncbi:MAG: isoleucine--tRNA ligase [Clostridia bacterium]|nr:isoleucine--tRNA ligase [Clostridia bacterium]
MAKDYTSTLNLPQTSFAMRANLPQREPEMLRYWEEIGLYDLMLENAKGRPQFLLHDGPPFSNGDIHMGHALNKTLKDIIVKSKAMEGYYTPYIPGWDNHGMPIESAIIKKNKLDRKHMTVSEFRSACHQFAQNFVDRQSAEFQRLGIVGDWKHPYTTMAPKFEEREVRVFGEMFSKGYIYKGLKPVYWCPHDETALAEAEIEYSDVKCNSIFVKFAIKDDKGKLASVCDLSKTYFIIWTTTTWTLPGNRAIALNPIENYVVVKAADGNCYIVAEPLAAKTMAVGGVENYEIVATMPGSEFEYMTAKHPFLDIDSLIVNADYVTMDSGTGCVHTAPGFGADDYLTGKRYGIEIAVPVDDRGYQTEAAGPYAGLYYDKSNEVIFNDIKENGVLFASEVITHSYPHCWRCKNPIIFRATPQWFCSVEAFKEEAVKACADVMWQPAWGGERIVQMVRERADWCISRQRHWGLPIPVFYCSSCGETICDRDSIDKVAKTFGEKGSNAWFDLDASEFLGADYVCPKCGCRSFIKETNTLDGWFDSGSTHFGVVEDGGHDPAWPKDMQWPADLYLEGADQYRGWFQSSLLTAVGAGKGAAPFKGVLTHGWTVDGEGKAMHKSLGNSISPDDIIKKYGADLVRLWVASSDYTVDVRCSDNIFKQLSEAYRKIRNTARIMLANLQGFDPDRDAVPVSEMLDIDRWALARLNALTSVCRDGYDRYEFHTVYHAINNFCTIDMSKLYIDITKDRVYVEKADSKERRSAQTALWIIIDSMTRLVAPLLAFTGEEIWQAMPHSAEEDKRSVYLNKMPEVNPEYDFDGMDKWEKLFALRDDVMKALELARAEKKIGKSLDAKVTVYSGDDGVSAVLGQFSDADLATVFITSGCSVKTGLAPEGAYIPEDGRPLAVLVSPADGKRCDRCWCYSVNGTESEDGFICSRCERIVSLIG